MTPTTSEAQPVNCAPLHSAFGPGCPYCLGTADRGRRGTGPARPGPALQPRASILSILRALRSWSHRGD